MTTSISEMTTTTSGTEMTTSGTDMTTSGTEITTSAVFTPSQSTDVCNSSTCSFESTSSLSTDLTSSNQSSLTAADAAARFYVALSLCLGAWAIAAFIIGGNVLIVFAVVHVRRLRTLSNLYIASLAIADCFVGVLLLPLGISFLPSLTHLFRDSYVGCMIFQGLIYCMAVCSGGHMMLVSVDRYLFLIKPFLYGRVMNERKVIASIVIIWLLSFVYGCGVFVFNKYEDVRNCNGPEVLYDSYNVYTSGSLYFLLMFVTAYIYCRIMVLAIQKHSAVKNTRPVQMGTTLETSVTKSDLQSEEVSGINTTVVPVSQIMNSPCKNGGFSALQTVGAASSSSNNEPFLSRQTEYKSETPSDKTKVSANHFVCTETDGDKSPSSYKASNPDSCSANAAAASELLQNTADALPGVVPDTPASASSSQPARRSVSNAFVDDNGSPSQVNPANSASVTQGTMSSSKALCSQVAPSVTKPINTGTNSSRIGCPSVPAEHKQSPNNDVDVPSLLQTVRSGQFSTAEAKHVTTPTPEAAKKTVEKKAGKKKPRRGYRQSEPGGSYWKAVRLFVCVFGCFFAFWLPYYVCLFVRAVYNVPQSIIDLCVMLGLLNSAVNFIVYAMISRDFRAFFKRFLCPCCAHRGPE